jgi:hypothetical protein
MGGKMRKPVISIKLTARMYAALANLGHRIVESLTGNISFVSPAPSLAALQAAITDVENAIALWGPKNSRGSHADLVNLRFKARVLSDMLKAEAQYVQTTAQAAAGVDYALMATIIISSGFGLANVPSPQGILEKVQNLHQFISRSLNRNQAKISWAKPLNVTSKNNVKEYRVLRADSTDITTAVEVAIVTTTSFTDTNTTNAVKVWTYWVIPYNGTAGVVSDPATVAVLGI